MTILPRRSFRNNSTGLTLTEIVVGLAIIGLVLGVIWVTMRAVTGNYKIGQAEKQLTSIVQNTRSLMRNTNFSGLPQVDMTTAFLAKGIFPGDALNDAGTRTVSPWRPAANNRNSILIRVGRTQDEFWVQYLFPNNANAAQDCLRFVFESLGQGPVAIQTSDAPTFDVPANITLTTFACPANTIAIPGFPIGRVLIAGFVFNLR